MRVKQAIFLVGGRGTRLGALSANTPKPMQEIAPGAALIVKRAKVPIVPVAIEGAFAVWPKHRMTPRTGKVRINFGKPVQLHHLESRAIVGEIDTLIRNLLDELHEIEASDRAPGLIGPLS